MTIFSGNFDSPHLIVAEDEKIFVEEMVGDQIVVQERYVWGLFPFW